MVVGHQAFSSLRRAPRRRRSRGPAARVDAGDVACGPAPSGGVVELAGGQLEAQVEQLLLGLGERLEALVVVELAELAFLAWPSEAPPPG
jgi:hypothetical protein